MAAAYQCAMRWRGKRSRASIPACPGSAPSRSGSRQASRLRPTGRDTALLLTSKGSTLSAPERQTGRSAAAAEHHCLTSGEVVLRDEAGDLRGDFSPTSHRRVDRVSEIRVL